MNDEYSMWVIYRGELACPVCDALFDAEKDVERYRFCPFCGNRLMPPKESEGAT